MHGPSCGIFNTSQQQAVSLLLPYSVLLGKCLYCQDFPIEYGDYKKDNFSEEGHFGFVVI